MVRVAAAVVLFATGCGRLGFGLFEDPPEDAPNGDSLPADATPDSSAFDLLINDGDLVGYWKLDDNLFLDSSLFANPANTCFTSCPTLAQGVRGMAADFHNSEGLQVGTV